MYEYDSQIALLNARQEDDQLSVSFPRSGILYLNHSRNRNEKQRVAIRRYDSDAFIYKVAALSMADYSTDELIRKKLYALLPFYFFTFGTYPYDNVFEEKITCETFINDLIKVEAFIIRSFENRSINAYTFLTLRNVIRKVVLYLCDENEKVKWEAMKIMGGTVWEIEEIKIYNEMMANIEKESMQYVFDELVKIGKLSRSEADELFLRVLSEKGADHGRNRLGN